MLVWHGEAVIIAEAVWGILWLVASIALIRAYYGHKRRQWIVAHMSPERVIIKTVKGPDGAYRARHKR